MGRSSFTEYEHHYDLGGRLLFCERTYFITTRLRGVWVTGWLVSSFLKEWLGSKLKEGHCYVLHDRSYAYERLEA